MLRLADPKNDVAFKKIFNSNNIEAVKDFLESVIDAAAHYPFSKKLVSVEFLDKDQMPFLVSGKRSLFDLKVCDDKGNIYIIEMQKRYEIDYLQRVQYYASHAIVDQLDRGEDHLALKPVIMISLMGAKCFPDRIPCISYHLMQESTQNENFLLGQSHLFIELPKLEASGLKGSTYDWLHLFKEAVHLESVPKLDNKNILNAYNILEQHAWTPEEREAYLAVRIDDEIDMKSHEHARQEGREEGLEEGLQKGREEGLQKGKAQIIKSMLAKNIDLHTISDLTGMPLKEIQSIQNTQPL